MKAQNKPFAVLHAAILVLYFFGQVTLGQQEPVKSQEASDVLRISAELVQTDVMVLDKQGRFVDGLKKEDFELRADGQPVDINFIDRVIAGSPREEAQIQAARGAAARTDSPVAFRSVTRGRSIIFFLDDYHLSAQSVEKTRKFIQQFIEKDMGPLDQVAIASATGQIGFLQQFTDNKTVLRAAVARLSYRPYVIQDNEDVPMTEYQAIRINSGDRDALTYYTNELMKNTNFKSPGGQLGPPVSGPAGGRLAISDGKNKSSGISREMAESQVKRRAEYLIKQSVNVTSNTLATLESLMRSSSQYPGRKLVFLVSDGFYLINNVSGAQDWVRRITDAATRAGVLIYSMDARGLTNTVDATDKRFDPEGKLSRMNIGELSSSQDALNALAEDTGGRALFNSDTFSDAISRALRETSTYYLLAWKPMSESQKGGRFRKIEVSIKGRPELSVRVPRGYLESDPKAARTSEQKSATNAPGKTETLKPVEAAFQDAMTSFAPKRGLPTIVSATYLDTPNNGALLTASMQVAIEGLAFGQDGKRQATLDIAGVVLTDQGKPAASFKTRLNVSPLSVDPAKPDTSSVIYNYRTPLKPGIYQVRVAARDDGNGKVGSSMQWVEIPDLSQKRLTLSSLLVGGQLVSSADKKAEATNQPIQFSVDHRFRRTSHLGFWIFIYNAQRDSRSEPDVSAQVQIFREGQVIVTTPQRKLSTSGMDDLARIPYGGDFALSGLPPGRYILQITVTDRIANTSASQRTSFDVD